MSNLFVIALTSFFDVPQSHFDNYSAQQSLLNPGNNSRLFELLAMTVVRYEDAFQDLMSDDPKERWTDDSGSVHPFLVKVAGHITLLESPLKSAFNGERK